MKNIYTVLALLLISQLLHAQNVNTGFTYQGELLENGQAVNGSFDFKVDVFTVFSGGTGFVSPLEYTSIPVSKGIFTLNNVDFGDLIFLSNDNLWLEVSVRPAGAATYTVLSPRQKIETTPYAVRASESDFALSSTTASKANDLNIAGASIGDVLAYDGSKWTSANGLVNDVNGGTRIGSSLITPPANGLSVEGNTRLGPTFTPTASSTLDINSSSAGLQDDPFRVRKNGNIKFYVDSNGGASVGSWNTPATDGLKVAGDTELNSNLFVDGNTRLGPTFTPTASSTLDINSSSPGLQDDPFRVRKNGNIKFYVDSNGGASVGSWNTPPTDGLKVAGDTVFNGDLNQDVNKSGLPKYIVEVDCTPAIFIASVTGKDLTGANGAFSASPVSTQLGYCYVGFPTSLIGKYWLVSTMSSNASNTSCDIRASDNTQLTCQRVSKSGAFEDGKFQIIVF